MALIVQKYGGTSVADLDRIRNVANRVIKTYDQGNDVVVILSAMAGWVEKSPAILSLPNKGECGPLQRYQSKSSSSCEGIFSRN